jgi:lysine-specific permease
LAAETGDVRIAPFTLILQRAGLAPAAHIMNAVILTAVMSAANSAMYAASRTLLSLSGKGYAPSWLGIVNERGVPVWSLAATIAISCLSFLGIFLGGKSVPAQKRNDARDELNYFVNFCFAPFFT